MGNTQNSIVIPIQIEGVNQVEAGIKKIASAVNQITALGSGGIAGFSVSALAGWVKELTSAEGAMGSFAKQLGQTVENVSRLSFATKKSAEDMKVLFGHFQRWQAEHGRSKDGLIPGLLELSKQFQDIESPATKAAIAQERFGKSGFEIIPFLEKGPAGIQELLNKADRLGLVTEDGAKKSKEFTSALKDFGWATDRLKEKIAEGFLPSLKESADRATDFVVSLRRFTEEHPRIVGSLVSIASAIAGIGSAIAAGKGIAALASTLGASAGAAAATSQAILLLGGIITGTLIANWVGGLKIMGRSIHNYLEVPILMVELGLARIQKTLGKDTQDEIDRILEQMARWVDQTDEKADAEQNAADAKRRADAEAARAQRERIIASKLELEEKRKEIQTRIQELDVQKDLANVDADTRDQAIEQLNRIKSKEEDIAEKRKLTTDAYTHKILTIQEANEYEIQDLGSLLQLQRERLKLQGELSNLRGGEVDVAKTVFEIEQRNFQLDVARNNGASGKLWIDKYRDGIKLYTEEIEKAEKKSQEFFDLASKTVNQKDKEDYRKLGEAYGARARDLRAQQVSDRGSNPDPDSFLENFGNRLNSLSKQIGSTADIIARNFVDVIGNSINTVSDGITGLIEGTATWGDLFRNVTRLVISSIVRMVVEWIAQMTIMRAIKAIFHATEISQANAQAAAKMPGALADSISSYGSAAAVGSTALIAAMSSIGSLVPSFAEGGYTGNGGKYDFGGVVHRGEYVMPAHRVSTLGVNTLDAMRAGRNPGVGGGVNVAILGTQSEVRRFMESNEGQKMIFDVVDRRWLDYGMRS